MADDDDAQFEQMSESEPADVEYMFAQTARGVSIADDRVALQGVSRCSFRTARIA